MTHFCGVGNESCLLEALISFNLLLVLSIFVLLYDDAKLFERGSNMFRRKMSVRLNPGSSKLKNLTYGFTSLDILVNS